MYKVESALLSMLPILNKDDSNQESTDFNAVAHHKRLQFVFEQYNIDIREWLLCQIADNCATNLELADLLKVTHVGCYSRKYNNYIKDMIAGTVNLKNFLDKVQKLLTEACSSIKNMAITRSLTARSMAVPVVTRWSGYAVMAYNFIESYDELLMAATDRDATSAFAKSLDSTRTYRDTARHHAKMLRELDIITVILRQVQITGKL
jgi:hypothetical protein